MDPTPEDMSAAALLPAFLRLCGGRAWQRRRAELDRLGREGPMRGRAAQSRHAFELALARLAAPDAAARATPAERRILSLAGAAVRLAQDLPPAQRTQLKERLAQALTGDGTLVSLFHQLHAAARYRASGFEVAFDSLAGGAGWDLVIRRDGAEAEVACETISAEEGRPVHRGDWYALVDRINPDLQRWLASHPGRYVLKMTLPEGLAGPDQAAGLHDRIMAMLAEQARQQESAAGILKLDPLMIAGATAADAPGGLQARLRAQFGPEAHLAVTGSASGGSVFVMAARAGRDNAVAEAVARRLAGTAARLSGRRPGILAAFLDDIDRGEWRALRETLELEGAVRRFLTTAPARGVVAVSCASRMELLGLAPPDAAEGGELRFRNPSHAAGRIAALAPAVA